MKISGKYLLVLISMCGLLASGVGLVTNVSGLFFSPIAEEFGILKGEASLMLTICNLAFATGGLLSPRLTSEKLFRPLLIGATAVLATSTAAFSLCNNIMLMYALSVTRGLAAGAIGFVFATSVLNRWFVANIGLATSIAMGCSGIAGAAFSPLIGGIIASAGWRMGFLVIAALTIALNLPAILFLPALDPSTKGMRALGAAESTSTSGQNSSSQETSIKAAQDSPTPIKPVLFVAVIAFAFLASALTALPQHFPGLTESYALDAAVGATMLSACMVANTVGKILLGVLIDRFGGRASLLLYALIVAGALALLFFVATPQVLPVAAALYGCCYAMAAVGNTMITRDAFGVGNYAKTYPVVSLMGNVANAAFSSIIGFMYDFSGGYRSTLIMFGAMSAALAALILFVYAQRGTVRQA
ncbi:MAG: MFS transporter [Coriobacteriales bacterium]|nr:MFS transporter [Coriobacteriales bacterium]